LVGRGNGHGAGVVSFPGCIQAEQGEGLGVFSSDTAKLRAETVMQTVQTDESTAHRPSSPVSTTHDSRLTTQTARCRRKEQSAVSSDQSHAAALSSQTWTRDCHTELLPPPSSRQPDGRGDVHCRIPCGCTGSFFSCPGQPSCCWWRHRKATPPEPAL
jgi:hypothetical protein